MCSRHEKILSTAMAAPKLSDIAKKAGVSIAAVSIALNDDTTKRVSAEKRQQIRQIAKDLGYIPNELAKALAENRTRLLGLVVPLRDPIFFNQFIAQALSGIQSTLMRRGYNLLVFSPSGKPGRATRDHMLESRFTDGIIFINTRSCSTRDINESIQELRAAGVKFSMINSYRGDAPINYVGVDDKAIGVAAAEYLISREHRRIAFLSSSATLPAHQLLTAGLRKVLNRHDLSLPDDNIGLTNYDVDEVFRTLDRWLGRKRNRPTAIFTADEQLMLHLYDYVEAHGLSMPGDIAVLGRGNAGFGDHLRPRPTYIALPTFQMGELAADLLIDTIEKTNAEPRQELLPFKFIQGVTA